MKIIFWSEFPNRVNWQKAKQLFHKTKLKAEIYVASKSLSEYKKWEKKISSKEIKVGAWLILSKKEGYWFSGFCSKRSIDKLNAFKGQTIKIDLEPPFPSWKYSNAKMTGYLLGLVLKKAPNTEYLEKTIGKLAKTSKILVNEFPFPTFLLKRAGCFYNIKGNKNIEKNFMLYSTIQGRFFMPLVKWIQGNTAKKIIASNKNASFSIGLIGHGILKAEGTYSNINQFKNDLDFVKKLGVKRTAIYSIDAIMAKKDSDKWIKIIAKYQK